MQTKTDLQSENFMRSVFDGNPRKMHEYFESSWSVTTSTHQAGGMTKLFAATPATCESMDRESMCAPGPKELRCKDPERSCLDAKSTMGCPRRTHEGRKETLWGYFTKEHEWSS